MKRLLVVCVVSAVGYSAAAEGIKRETSLSIGLTATDGNSDTAQGNMGLESLWEWSTAGSVNLGVEANYGEQRVGGVKEKNLDNTRATLNGKRLFSSRTYLYGGASVRRDDIALIDYRGTVGPGIGSYLVQQDALKLLVDVGASYVFEDVAGEKDDYAALRIGQEYRQALSESSKIWQTLEYLPRFDDLAMYLINAEIGVESAINAHMNLRLVLQNKYDSDPPDGVESNDISIVAGFGIRL